MEEKFIPDYSKYETEFLVDVYTRIDRENNPLKARALDSEIKKRFNLSPDIEINPKVVISFLNTYQEKAKRSKGIMNKNEEMIKQGWIAGVVVGSITFLTWFIAMLRNDSSVQGINLTIYNFIDILGLFALAYGMFRKSRICAITLTSYFILIKIIHITLLPYPQNIFSIIGLLIFSPFFIRATIGTFNNHKNNLPVTQEIV